MPIAMTDGTTYENSLDMLFAKDMPSREETDRQQKMKDMDQTMPPDMRGPPPPAGPTENNQLSEPSYKDQNDPYSWGMGPSMDRTGPAMVPNKDPDFHEVMGQLDYLINPEKIQATPEKLPPNARPTVAETKPSGFGEVFDKALNYLKTAPEGSGFHPDFIPTAQQFIDAPWKEKLGFIMAASMMLTGPGRGMKVVKDEVIPPSHSDPLQFWKEGLAEYDKIEHPVINTLRQAEQGGSEVAGRLLEQYRKIDNPVMRQEFGNIVKQKIQAAAEGGETAPSNITNPEVFQEGGPPGPGRPLKEGSAFTETITKPDGTKVTTLDQSKIGRMQNLLENGSTYQEVADKLKVSRNSVASMVNRLKNQKEEIETPAPKDLSPREASDALLERLKAEGQAKPFVPRGAVNAPEKGSGSGGEPPNINDYRDALKGKETKDTKDLIADIFNAENPRVKTILRTNKPINTPITEPTSEPANDQPTSVRKQKIREEPVDKGGQIDNPALDAALEREWQRMVNKDKPGTFEHAEDVQARRRDLKLIDRMPDAIKRMLTPPEKPKK